MTKGSKAGVEDDYFDWDEEENLKHYNIAFYDFPDLFYQPNRFLHPWFNEQDALYLPSRDDVEQFVGGGNDLVIRLPEENIIELRGMDRDGNHADDDGNPIRYECDLLEWLPIGVILDSTEDGSDNVDVADGFDDWSSCFSEGFEWKTIIGTVAQRGLYGSGKAYTDPRPEDRDPGDPVIKSRVSPSRYGPEVREKLIAVENVGRSIASEASLQIQDGKGDTIVSDGSIFLIPEHPEKEFDEFVQDILVDVYDMDIEPVPEWVSSYKVPGEDDLRSELESLESQVAELEDEVEKAEWFRQLLFANDDLEQFELEEPVREAFREVGFQVDGEEAGGRDGGIMLEDEIIILEVTGRRRGVKPGKIDKLAKHVASARESDYCDDCSGLLVYNSQRKRDPGSRSLNVDNFVEDLERTGFKFMTSVQVYLMLSLYKQGEISRSDIEEKLTGEDHVVEFGDGSGMESKEDLASWVSSIRVRLDELF